MKIRTAVLVTMILFNALGTVAAQAGSRKAAGEKSEIILANGTTMIGILRAVAPSRYIVQGVLEGELNAAEVAFEVSGDLIRGVDGRSTLPAFDSRKRIIESEWFERVMPNGDVEMWRSLTVGNNSQKLLTYASWDVADREVASTREMLVMDMFGQELVHRLEEADGEHGRRVVVELEVPVAPGESLDLALRLTQRGALRRDGDLLSYTFSGGFSGETILLRKIELPAGAEIVAIEPEPLYTFEYAGKPLVIWRRYYGHQEILPQTITFRLP
ncbi:MAG: hypothetical protein GY835_16045 [bacterium]|nr:hypothetical protein [bacterium]